MSAQEDSGQNPSAKSANFSILGQRHRKVDAMERLTGLAQYTDDLALPRMLHAKILRSPHAHARILRIDASRALAIPGVHAVIEAATCRCPTG